MMSHRAASADGAVRELFTALGRHVRVTFSDLPGRRRAGFAEFEVLGNR